MATQTLTHEQFTRLAIERLRGTYEGKAQKGIHTVYSGFNAAFRAYFADTDPVKATEALEKAGKVYIRRGIKGGVVLMLPEDAPVTEDKGAGALAKMGL